MISPRTIELIPTLPFSTKLAEIFQGEPSLVNIEAPEQYLPRIYFFVIAQKKPYSMRKVDFSILKRAKLSCRYKIKVVGLANIFH